MKPLQGRRILVTRRSGQAAPLIEALSAQGATVLDVPLIAREPPDDPAPLDAALGRLERYDWLAFTSANAVEAVAERLARLGVTLPVEVRLASVGPATAAAIAARFHGRRADLQPALEYRAEGLVDAFREQELAGRRVLLPVSNRARDALVAGLRAQRAQVDAVIAYRTVAPPGSEERLAQALADGIDLVTLASPSAVEAFVAAAGPKASGAPAAAMGPVTAEAARAAGLDVKVVAEPSTVEGLLASLARHFASEPGAA